MSGNSPSTPGTGAREEDQHAIPRALPDLARELTGDLPCAGCGYNLRSQSIRGVCPECGTAVRVTLLARVDPMADVLRPIPHPTVTAMGLLVCIFAALAGAILTWSLRATDAWVVLLDRQAPPLRPLVMAGTAAVVLSGLGSLALLRPHAGIGWRKQISAASGTLAIFAFAVVYWRIHALYDPVHARPYLQGAVTDERHLLRLAGAACLVIAALGLRPNIRLLAARSLVMRMGRVDRQTMMALAAAVMIGALGDVLHLAAARMYGAAAGVLSMTGTTLIVIGSVLFTVGLIGMVIDGIRLVPVLLRPPLTMAQLIGDKPGVRGT